MIIALPTNDRISLAKRTGRCEEFAIYKIENNNAELVEYRKNTHEHHGHHDHNHGEGDEHSHNDIMETLTDIDLLVIIMAGKHFKKDLENFSINFEMTKELDIKTVLESYK